MMPRFSAPQPVQAYAIRIGEYLDDECTAWFSPLTVDHASEDETLLVVQVRDQAELHGLLIKIRDLNLTLVEIVKV